MQKNKMGAGASISQTISDLVLQAARHYKEDPFFLLQRRGSSKSKRNSIQILLTEERRRSWRKRRHGHKQHLNFQVACKTNLLSTLFLTKRGRGGAGAQQS